MPTDVGLLETLATRHPSAAAQLLEGMPVTAVREVVSQVPAALLLQVVPHMSPALGASCLLHGDKVEDAVATLAALAPETAAAILRAAPQRARDDAISQLPPQSRSAISRSLRFESDMAAALLEPGALAIAETLSVGEALERVRSEPGATTSYVYLLGGDRRLTGVVSVLQLVRADPAQAVAPLAERAVVALQARESWERVMQHAGWDRFHRLPVVDKDGRFLGAIRLSTVRIAERKSVPEKKIPWAKTGGALAELYGTGMRGLLEWTLVALEPRDAARDDAPNAVAESSPGDEATIR